jgi:P27 family predicted phage terminase small subunit
MGQRGPAKQPSIVRYVRGDPSKEGFSANEPKPLPASLSPPDDLEGVALDKWMDTVPKLQAMGVFTEADRGTWHRYCIEFALWKRNVEMVNKYGDVMRFKPKAEGEAPYMQVSPFATQMMKLAASLLRIEQQFGLTPSSRSQVQIHRGAEDDPFETFIATRGA